MYNNIVKLSKVKNKVWVLTLDNKMLRNIPVLESYVN